MFCLNITPTAEAGTIPGQTTADHDLADIIAFKVAEPNTSVVGAFAVEFAPQGAALNQVDHGLCGRGATRIAQV